MSVLTANKAFIVSAVLCALSALVVPARAAEKSKLSFASTSIRLAHPSAEGTSLTVTPRGLTARGITVKELVSAAYHHLPSQIVGGPAWVDSTRFDIDANSGLQDTPAKSLAGVPDGDQAQLVWLMTQTLLEQHFQLRTHRAQLPLYKLAVGPQSAKLRESKERPDAERGMRSSDGNTLIGEGATTEALANALAQRLSRPVLNHTGLTGNYDFRLTLPANEKAPQQLATAIQDQLGLKLTAFPVETLVIDRAEQPSDG